MGLWQVMEGYDFNALYIAHSPVYALGMLWMPLWYVWYGDMVLYSVNVLLNQPIIYWWLLLNHLNTNEPMNMAHEHYQSVEINVSNEITESIQIDVNENYTFIRRIIIDKIEETKKCMRSEPDGIWIHMLFNCYSIPSPPIKKLNAHWIQSSSLWYSVIVQIVTHNS